MKLNDEQNEKVKKYLNEKWPEPSRACTVCGKDDWKYLEYLFALSECDPEYPPFKGYVLPVIALVCIHCGNLMLFSAKCMGVINGRE